MRRADLADSLAYIQQQKPDFQPKVGLILGSGLGGLAEQIQQSVKIPYANIPNFPRSTVSGHHGQLVLGELGNMPIACMQGRIHGYEGASNDDFKKFIRVLSLLGCDTLLITNAAGSLRSNISPGELMVINDHINLQTHNPLKGANDEEFGPRFFALTDAYDARLRQRILQVAAESLGPLTEGVYIAVDGPHFETAAEIRAFRQLGADLVGMSTVPEVLVARHCGMRVAAISSVTNLAAGMGEEMITHEGTLHMGKIAAGKLSKLIIAVLKSLAHAPC